MTHFGWKQQKRTARGLLALMAGAWLFASAAPCVMASPAPMPMDHVCCPDKTLPASAECDTLSALDCQLPKPTPPSVLFDLPMPTLALLYAVPSAPVALRRHSIEPPPRADISPPPHLSHKHTRLLI